MLQDKNKGHYDKEKKLMLSLLFI